MDNTEHDPWAAPPDWVHLPDVPVWIERNLNYPGLLMVQGLIAALRTRRLKYRIGGLGPTLAYVSGYGPRLPDGLVVGDSPRRVMVADWEKAQPHWQSGTVAGFRTNGNDQSRLPVEVWWLDVARWAPPIARDLAYAARKAATKPARQPRRGQGLDYAAADVALVEEGRTGIANGTYRNPTDAARALAKRATGAGKEESKVKRLLRRIQSVQSRSAAEQD